MPKAHEAILSLQRRRWLRSLVRCALFLAAILLSCWYVGLFDFRRLAEGLPSIVSLVAEMLPPDFSDGWDWAGPVFATLAMSVAGTALAVAGSLPLALLAARNTSPHPLVYRATRGLLNVLRTIPELFLGVILIVAVGFGALPGALALGLHSIGMVGKFFAEAIEHADDAPIQAVRAAGASPLQVILHGILPQVLPQLVDTTVYRWEYNIRASTVMGAVGAGGIGLQLIAAQRTLQYQKFSAILLLIFVMVTVVDGLGSYFRRRFR
jgi:phosphonate transport system permease protein